MKNRIAFFAVTALMCSASALAQDNGFWKPLSTTARGITGEIAISGEKLMINFTTFTIADIRSLTGAEGAAVFDMAADSTGSGKLYRLDIPAKKTFLHRNAMCGAEDTEWMATFVNGKTLQVAFLSGSKMPTFTPEAIGNTTLLCGTFSYTR